MNLICRMPDTTSITTTITKTINIKNTNITTQLTKTTHITKTINIIRTIHTIMTTNTTPTTISMNTMTTFFVPHNAHIHRKIRETYASGNQEDQHRIMLSKQRNHTAMKKVKEEYVLLTC